MGDPQRQVHTDAVQSALGHAQEVVGGNPAAQDLVAATAAQLTLATRACRRRTRQFDLYNLAKRPGP